MSCFTRRPTNPSSCNFSAPARRAGRGTAPRSWAVEGGAGRDAFARVKVLSSHVGDFVIARSGATKQSSTLLRPRQASLDCFAALAMTPERPHSRGAFFSRPSFAARQGIKTSLKKKGGGAPTGASIHYPRYTRRRYRLKVPRARKRPSGDRSPLGAPPRRLPRKLMPWLSPGRASRETQCEGVTSA
jgi:hypothetical protein